MTTRPRQPVDAAAVLQAVAAETRLRPRGAQAAVARRLGVARSTVSRALGKCAAPDDLRYVECPGEREIRERQARDAAERQAADERLLCELVVAPVVARTLPVVAAPHAPTQRPAPDAIMVSVNTPPMRDDTHVAVLLGQVALVEVLVSGLLLMSKSVWLGLPPLVLCVVAALVWWRWG